MTKTGRRDETIDFRRTLTKLANFRICGKIFDQICTFWRTKNGICGGKIWRRSRENIKSEV